ncbi:MAG: hypothetical protein D6824_07055 [Planctomycetota bacterium]|nr:MAG: hypothetical protein D6824_07055 [Planctomycetota bacterium]
MCAPIVTACCLLLPGCAAPQVVGARREALVADARATIDRSQRKDPTIAAWFDSAFGYAVFPRVGKGAIGLGGAHGVGVVFEQGKPVGTAALTQATLGLQLGGQAYSEVIFFQDAEALERFKRGQLALAAQASIAALTAGGAAEADYDQGVAVFALPQGGLMYELSIGGQQFRFRPFEPEPARSDASNARGRPG